MNEYNCPWSSLPPNLKTENSLIKMGIYKKGPVRATIKTNSGVYSLYDLDEALALEQKKGNKMLHINANNLDNFIIMEMSTTGDSSTDEIVHLVLLDMWGNLLLNQYFKPQKELSKSAQEKNQLNKFYLKQMPQWDEYWDKIKEFIVDRTLLIPNTSYGQRLFKQTCARYNCEIDFQFNCLCSRETIQHKFSLLDLFKVPETEIQNPLKDSFETLKILYPKSPLYSAQTKARNYFDRLCQYKIKQGDGGAYDKGWKWLQKEFRLGADELDFDKMTYNTCMEIIKSLEVPLDGLGLL